jgi:hypothetical protein
MTAKKHPKPEKKVAKTAMAAGVNKRRDVAGDQCSPAALTQGHQGDFPDVRRYITLIQEIPCQVFRSPVNALAPPVNARRPTTINGTEKTIAARRVLTGTRKGNLARPLTATANPASAWANAPSATASSTKLSKRPFLPVIRSRHKRRSTRRCDRCQQRSAAPRLEALLAEQEQARARMRVRSA